jgi:neutral ceramidase
VARGYWGSLRVTAFYFEDAAGRGLALVSCDLFAIPAGLHAQVAARLHTLSAGEPVVDLPAERLLIAASHTHHGPGNYLSSAVYNSQASAKSGFSRDLREFLVAQVTTAIQRAVVDARQDVVFALDVVTSTLPATLLSNRSPTTFMRDRRSHDIMQALGIGISPDPRTCAAARQPDEPKAHWALEGCPRLRAVDRNVTALRLTRRGRLDAVALFVNAHPTVLPGGTAVNAADIFGVVRTELADVTPVVAFFNGTEGDVVTRRTARTARDVVELGRVFAAHVRPALARAGTPIDLSSGVSGRLHFARPGESEPTRAGDRRLTRSALAGVATIGGPEGDRTWIGRLGFAGPTVQPPHGEHGVKVGALGWFRRLIAGPRDFPQALPLGHLNVGSFRIAWTSTEASTAAGWGIRQALGGAPHGALEIVSLANGYASYLASEDEYQAQDYMGASTFWGPQQAEFIAAVLARLSHEPPGVSGTPGPDRPGKAAMFGASGVGRRRRLAADGFGRLLEGGLVPRGRLPSFEWCEGPTPVVAVGERTVVVVPIDGGPNDTAGVLVVLRGPPAPGVARWGAVWMTPLWTPVTGHYRFEVTTGIHQIQSDEFTVGESPPPACPPRERN